MNTWHRYILTYRQKKKAKQTRFPPKKTACRSVTAWSLTGWVWALLWRRVPNLVTCCWGGATSRQWSLVNRKLYNRQKEQVITWISNAKFCHLISDHGEFRRGSPGWPVASLSVTCSATLKKTWSICTSRRFWMEIASDALPLHDPLYYSVNLVCFAKILLADWLNKSGLKLGLSLEY